MAIDRTTQPPDDTTPPDVLLEHVRDLQAILTVSRQLAGTTELSPLLLVVERAALEVLDCERATVFVYDEPRNELVSRLATGLDAFRVPADRGIVGEAVRTREVVDVPDAYADARFNRDVDQQTGFRTRNLLTLPLLGFDDRVVGVLQALNKRSGDFNAWDHELARAFADQVGVALQRQLLLEHYATKKKIESDLQTARDIQRGLLPGAPPAAGGIDVAGWNQPADETGGDFFDYFVRDDGSVALTIADATGHGIGPALIAAQCRALFRATASGSDALEAMAERINDLMCADLLDDRFATAVFGLLDVEQAAVQLVSAGHGPNIHYIAAEDRFVELPAAGMPLGILPGIDFSEVHHVALAPGDLLVLITDGFFEWENHQSEACGMQRLYAAMRGARGRSSAEIIEALHAAAREHGAGRPQNDDLTAVVVRRPA
ncbi:MAG: SpoIIE family protein phosphatase [Myxococcales bacterium]|nr:SpoIIE family protein phosphatase [Myxococcales bacterium]